MPVLEDLGDKKGTNSHWKKQRDHLPHSTKCVLQRKEHDEPRGHVGEDQQGWTQGAVVGRWGQAAPPADGPVQAAARSLPAAPQPTQRGSERGSQHNNHPRTNSPARTPLGRARGSWQSRWRRVQQGDAAGSSLRSLAGTKHRDSGVSTRFVYPKAEGCFHFGLERERKKARRRGWGGGVGIFKL